MDDLGREVGGVNQTGKTEQGQKQTQLEAKQVHRLPRKQLIEIMVIYPPSPVHLLVGDF